MPNEDKTTTDTDSPFKRALKTMPLYFCINNTAMETVPIFEAETVEAARAECVKQTGWAADSFDVVEKTGNVIAWMSLIRVGGPVEHADIRSRVEARMAKMALKP